MWPPPPNGAWAGFHDDEDHDMNLMEALKEEVTRKHVGVTNAKIVVFAFSELSDVNAFVSQIEPDIMVPLVEAWCRKQREEMGPVH